MSNFMLRMGRSMFGSAVLIAAVAALAMAYTSTGGTSRESLVAEMLSNFILVLGEKEEAAGEVNVRTRDNVQQGSKPLADFVAQLRALIAEHQ